MADGRFAARVRAYEGEAARGMDDFVRRVIIDAYGRLVLRSPVGNPDLWAANAQGAFSRQNHNAYVEEYNANVRPDGKKVRRRGQKALKAMYPNKVGAGYVGGRFRASWRIDGPGVNWSAAISGAGPMPTAAELIQAATEGALRVQAGGVTLISNPLPYAQRLEYGWSKQAPQGMVRLTLIEMAVHYGRR